jgi:DNA-binding CsgD family transcriptional regulator
LLLRSWGLTARENAVALQVIRGLSTAETAANLGISPHTVQDHLKAVFAKTGVRSRRDLARTVLQGSAH